MQKIPHNLDIIKTIRDPKLIGGELGEAQETCLRLLYGLDLTLTQRRLAKKHSDAWDGRRRNYQEGVFVCGRRSGKSDRLAANVAVYEACFGGHEQYLSPGERAWAMCIAASKKQAGIALGYIKGKLEGTPLLRTMIEDIRAEEIDLTNGVSLGVYPCSYRTIRGVSVCAAVCDEVSFWQVEGVNVDREVLSALRPSLATFPRGKLVVFSSPYARMGELYNYYKKRHETKDVLVWQAPTKVMNPSISDKFLKREKERDPENYEREWLAQFSENVSGFLSAESIESCVVGGRAELPHKEGFVYHAALDSAFRGDLFTFSVGHKDPKTGKVVIDLLRGWQGSKKNPVNLDQVLTEIVELLARYHTRIVTGDQYCSEPLKQAFIKKYIHYEELPFSSGLKQKIYTSLKHLITQKEIELLDHPKSIKELKRLECRLTNGGNFTINASHGGHDDFATVVALASWSCVAKPSREPCVRVV